MGIIRSFSFLPCISEAKLLQLVMCQVESYHASPTHSLKSDLGSDPNGSMGCPMKHKGGEPKKVTKALSRYIYICIYNCIIYVYIICIYIYIYIHIYTYIIIMHESAMNVPP